MYNTLKSKLEDLEKLFGDLPHFTFHDNGSLTQPYMDGDDDQLMYIPADIDTSGLLSKSASGDQVCLITMFRKLEQMIKLSIFPVILVSMLMASTMPIELVYNISNYLNQFESELILFQIFVRLAILDYQAKGILDDAVQDKIWCERYFCLL